YLNKNYPTDILTFPYSTGRNINADIFISLDRALSQSKEYNHSFKQEILFLVLHGVLHLTGWDDSDERLRQKMLSRQEELLRKINVFLARYLLILLLNCIFQF
ncbi:MAG: rRNA maturation RNase YbeY, partial [Elusimicrobiota bacterium]